MKQEKTINRKINKYTESIKKIRDDESLDRNSKKRAIYNLQSLIRELKWVLE